MRRLEVAECVRYSSIATYVADDVLGAAKWIISQQQ